MNYFWGNVFEYFKERRYAAVFFGTLAGLVGAIALGALLIELIYAYDMEGYLIYALPGLALLFSAWVGHGLARARARRRDRYKISPLSRDELTKARSKLLKR